MLLSANALNLDPSEYFSFGKEFMLFDDSLAWYHATQRCTKPSFARALFVIYRKCLNMIKEMKLV